MDRRLFVLAVGMFALGTDSFVVAAVLPGISHAFGVSIGAAGQMASIYSVTFALLSPPIAALAATIPRKRLLLCGGVIFVLANLGTVIAPTFGLALLSRIIAGVGAATFSPTATGAAVMLVRPEHRGYALSVVVAGLTVSTALGTPIGAVIGGLGDWRWTMGFVAALGALSVAGIAVFLSEVPLPPKVTLAKRLEPLMDGRVVLTLATTLIALSGIFTVYTYFAVVFDRTIGGNAVVLGCLLVLWGIGGTVSNLFGGRVVDVVGSRKVIVTILILLAVFSAVLPWIGSQLWIAAPVICEREAARGHDERHVHDHGRERAAPTWLSARVPHPYPGDQQQVRRLATHERDECRLRSEHRSPCGRPGNLCVQQQAAEHVESHAEQARSEGHRADRRALAPLSRASAAV